MGEDQHESQGHIAQLAILLREWIPIKSIIHLIIIQGWHTMPKRNQTQFLTKLGKGKNQHFKIASVFKP